MTDAAARFVPAGPRLRHGLARAALLAALGAGLWLAGTSVASAGEPVVPAQPMLSAPAPVGDPVPDVTPGTADGVRTVAEPVAAAVEPVRTVAAPVAAAAVEPVRTVAAPVADLVPTAAVEPVRTVADLVPTAATGPGGILPIEEPLPGAAGPQAPAAQQPVPDHDAPAHDRVLPAAGPADVPVGAAAPAKTDRTAPATGGDSAPAPVAPFPTPALPVPSGTGGTSGPGHDSVIAALPGGVPAPAVLAAGARDHAPSGAVRRIAFDPSSTPD